MSQRWCYVVLSLFISIEFVVLGQDYTVPSSWRSPTITLPVESRLELVKNAVEVWLPMVNATDGRLGDNDYATAFAYWELAQYDMKTTSPRFRETILQWFSTRALQNPLFEYPPWISTGLVYGYAAILALRAYDDPRFLDFAVRSWETGTRYTLSSEQAAAGFTFVKNYTIQPTCHGATMAGGTFQTNEANSTKLDSFSTAWYAILSGLLAETTGNTKYLEAANKAAKFIYYQLYNGYYVQRSIYADTEVAHLCEAADPTVFGQHNGVTIEAVAILNAVLKDEFSATFMNRLVLNFLDRTDWNGPDGIMTLNTSEVKKHDSNTYSFRGVEAVYRRTADSVLKTYLERYLSVQFNAITELARVKETNIYGKVWGGPPYPEYSALNQTAAIVVLLAGLDIGVGTPRRSNTPVIAGATTGGICGIVLLLIVILLIRRQRRRHRTEEPTIPFIAQSSPNPSRRISTLFTKRSRHSRVPASTSSSEPRSQDKYLPSTAATSPAPTTATFPIHPTTHEPHSPPASTTPNNAISELSIEQLAHILAERLNRPPEYRDVQE